MTLLTDEQRFQRYVTEGDLDACWEWKGSRSKSGYGHNPGLSEVRAHRMSWVLYKGPIPEGMNVLHKCDNPPCCNPNHLFLGTPKTNAEDRDNKNRGVVPRGEQCHTAILTEEKVAHILLISSQGLSNQEIALLYGVRTKVIRRVVRCETWKHVSMQKAA